MKLFVYEIGLGLCLVTAAKADDTSYQEWQFGSDADPTPPTLMTNTAGEATATVMGGFLASGWMDSLGGFGSQTGLWDIGFQNPDDPGQDTRGFVLLSVPNPKPDASNSYTDLGVRVIQFVDGFIYTGELYFSLPGADFVGRTVVENLQGQLAGRWVEDSYHWRLTPCPEQISLTVTGAVRGTLLDGIKVETVSQVVDVPQFRITSIERGAQSLSISWTGGVPPYQVYTTSNLLGDAWQAIGEPLTGTNADIPLDADLGFIRVGASN